VQVNPAKPLIQVSPLNWESEYSCGDWDYLGSSSTEVMHYSVLASLAGAFKRPRYILDVCCGEGLLVEYLRLWGFERYLGVDLAFEALSKASSRSNSNTIFQQADAKNFTTDKLFTCIIFCECLCYLGRPIDQLQRYSSMLTPDGVILASIYLQDRRVESWVGALEKRFNASHSILISNSRGAWKCFSFEKCIFTRPTTGLRSTRLAHRAKVAPQNIV
jgi:predicted TPR repeat methyltransferase